jgi:FkbM family methyltransferase
MSHTNATDAELKLKKIQSTLKIKHGTFQDEYPEQLLSVMFLKGNEKVLEIGGNIGRNSLIISSILEDSQNLVVFESHKLIAKQLLENKILNNLHFHVIDKALSKLPLIQHLGSWNCTISEIVPSGFIKVDTITYNDFKQSINIDFDTLVIDCEGAFYHILVHMPEILENIKTIIMENDYYDNNHKIYVDDILKKNNFNVVFSMPLTTHPGMFLHTRDRFYEVWKK